ncbi:hypothetical protein LCGC14_2587620 [marine sediment metagenome]|uniref:Uncharacterized protein n=1 Tax=marine sediment metagenome TaxID=412755 RepID=A0A0F9CNQ9_9ZZZZ
MTLSDDRIETCVKLIGYGLAALWILFVAVCFLFSFLGLLFNGGIGKL